MSEWINIVNESEIEEGHYVSGDLDDVEILVFKIKGDFFALEDICTHDHICLKGGIVEDEEIECPHHGAKFNIKTGEATCVPAYSATAKFPVQVVDGMVQVRDDRWD
ncbi:MAG: non-heme iron oxygenase ferredoxin subunit [Methylococcales bacterium]|jgi:3-phenylpropionate/trans-cinnamate dioxygenase ferredoxin subunit|nr:non-heme iron oxygenase ferredoxin subunit [Methylococcales bacterium]MBT7410283.1 non-heme iron oxygenase ferredoxin subunit [Methylococcales bacterium]